MRAGSEARGDIGIPAFGGSKLITLGRMRLTLDHTRFCSEIQ
jgi:hypothetical protein